MNQAEGPPAETISVVGIVSYELPVLPNGAIDSDAAPTKFVVTCGRVGCGAMIEQGTFSYVNMFVPESGADADEHANEVTPYEPLASPEVNLAALSQHYADRDDHTITEAA